MHPDIQSYNNSLSTTDSQICNRLCEIINLNLPKAENKIWHAHPVWFLDGNPIVGYSKLKIVYAYYFGADNRLTNLYYKMKVNLKLQKCALLQ